MRTYTCNQDFGTPASIIRMVRRTFPEAGFVWDYTSDRIFRMRVLRVDEFDFDILDEIMERYSGKR